MALWTKKRIKAAQLVADDKLTDTVIAKRVGINLRTLTRWKQEPEFAARVDELVAEFAAAAQRRDIARRDVRLAHLQELHDRLMQVIDERAGDKNLRKVRGGKTGLMILSDVKTVGGKVVPFYTLDTSPVREIRAIYEQVAEELGQRVKKHELTGKDGGPIESRSPVDLSKLSDEQLEAYLDILAACEGGTARANTGGGGTSPPEAGEVRELGVADSAAGA